MAQIFLKTQMFFCIQQSLNLSIDISVTCVNLKIFNILIFQMSDFV